MTLGMFRGKSIQGCILFEEGLGKMRAPQVFKAEIAVVKLNGTVKILDGDSDVRD